MRRFWRYFELLPIKDESNVVTLREGYTPVLPSKTFKNLSIKDESLNPTATFKAREIAVAVSRAKELNIKDIAMPSAGNARGALSLYCARAGIKAHVFMPEDTGNDAHNESESGWFDMSTLKEPYQLEGKKTMGFEIAEWGDWNLPDAVLYPTGGGTGLIGIWKGFSELEEMGYITEKSRMISVQSSGCAPIVKAFTEGRETCEKWENPETVAAGLKVPKPFADRLILRTIRESGGLAVTVTDEEILLSIKELALREGIYACPEGAATYAAFKNLLNSGDLSRNEKVLLINTGSGLKYSF